MAETNINTKGAFGLNMQNEPIREINSISDLPKISSFILPKGFELLPNTSEVFELEFAFYEWKEILHCHVRLSVLGRRTTTEKQHPHL